MTEFKTKKIGDISFGFFPQLECYGIVHGFTQRTGGDSDLVPQNLNMALHVGDNSQKVLANRNKVAQALNYDAKRVTTCAQVHGHQVVEVTPSLIGKGAFAYEDTIRDTDGLITREKEAPLMLFYADCVPVMLVDTKGTGIALVHAGWRGAVGNIALRALEMMEERFGTEPKNVVAALGSSIGPCCYEVDAAVLSASSGYEECFTPTREGHWHLNLWQVNRLQLERLGVPSAQIWQSDCCTNDHVDEYFSYRHERGKTGRLAAIIYRR